MNLGLSTDFEHPEISQNSESIFNIFALLEIKSIICLSNNHSVLSQIPEDKESD